jgi:two-component system, chemotaxis family, CheB/CheR fusion protein
MTSAERNPAFEALLIYLRQSRGFDFTGYKRSTLIRRVSKRMQILDVGDFGDYLDYLEVHPEEFNFLFNTILINVTSFFRDAVAWEYLKEQVFPLMIAQKQSTEQIRIWSAGCASGEEAYTLAILMAENLGIEQFRQRVKIYATDVDEEALNQSRQALYSTKDIEEIPVELRQKYFEPTGNRYIFRQDLRRSVIFGRHDLLQDAPISRLDLLVCRNTLMYFNSETQGRVLARFHFALNDRGFLFLGKAEISKPKSFLELLPCGHFS